MLFHHLRRLAESSNRVKLRRQPGATSTIVGRQ
jgi:hypothetical protein